MKKKILIIAGWLLIWQLLALIVHNDILMVGPIETIRAFVEMAGTAFSGCLFGIRSNRFLLVFYLEA